MKLLLSLAILLSFSLCFSAELPSNYRFEMMAGYNQLKYHEEVTNTFRETAERNQSGYHLNARFIYYWWPTYFYTILDVDYTDGSKEHDGPYKSLSFIETTATAVVETPMLFDRFTVGMAFSAINLKNMNPTSDFSLDNNTALFVYPEIRFYPTFFRENLNYTFYFRYNLVRANNAPRDDLILGLRLYLPIQPYTPKYPLFAYQRNLVLQFEYADTEIRDNTLGVRTKVFHIERFLLSLGFNI